METFLLLGAERDGLALVEFALRQQRALSFGGNFDFALAWDERCEAQGELARAVVAGMRAGEARPFGGVLHDRYDVALRAWPHARFVYLARDAAGAAPHGAQLRASDRAWRRIACEIAPERRLELRYERLVAELAGQLARVSALLGVDLAAAAARGANATCARSTPPCSFTHELGARFARLRGE